MPYQKCPVCFGRTVVRASLYPDIESVEGTSNASNPLVACRSCGGKGIVGGDPVTYVMNVSGSDRAQFDLEAVKKMAEAEA